MSLVVAFVLGWCQCVWEILTRLGGSPWHAVAVSSRKHWQMARALWMWRRWARDEPR
jgi:hypothetical protein